MSAKAVFLALAVLATMTGKTQCAVPDTAGSTGSILSILNNGNRPVAADPLLNTVVMIYRQNNTLFSGNSGLLRYSLSTDGGMSWQQDQGPVNPLSTSHARYPNAAICNPVSNISPSQAYLLYKAPTSNLSGAWDGKVNGVRRLDGTGNTESYNSAGPGTVVPISSLVKGAPGEYWACGLENLNAIAGNNLEIYRGQWTSNHDVAWTTQTVITLPAVSFAPKIGDINIGFDPDGVKGWITAVLHPANLLVQNKHLPVFYSTSDGGTTWNGPVVLDIGSYSCFTASLGANPDPGLGKQSSLVVDALGNPHMLVIAGASDNNHGLDYSKWHALLDITRVNGMWAILTVAELRSSPFTMSVNLGEQQFTPQASRSSDGTKVFFSWSDNQDLTFGAPLSTPDVLGRGLDVLQHKWTGTKNFTKCNPAVSGNTWLLHVAAEVLENSPGQFKLAPMFLQSESGNDPTQPWNVLFLDNCTFGAPEFTIHAANASFTPMPGLYIPLCMGDSLALTMAGNFSEIRWFEGTSTVSLSVNGHGTYSVTVRQGCDIGIASFTVAALTVSTSISSVTICPDETVTLTANGNGTVYTWEPGKVVGSTLITTPPSSVVYTVSAGGAGSCIATSAVAVTVEECTSLAENGGTLIGVFPVPAKDQMEIITGIPGTLSLSNLVGERVLLSQIGEPGSVTWHVGELPRGLYFITLQGRITWVQKVVLN